MKLISDIVQKLVSLPDWWGLLACVAIFTGAWQLRRLTWLLLKWAWKAAKFYVRNFWGRSNGEIATYFAACLLGGYMLFKFRVDFSDWLQRQETPVYIHQFDNMPLDEATSIFERKITAINHPAIANHTIGRTRALADSLHIPALWIYQCALSECALNPTTIRKDRIAAGWIQFTTVGLSGIEPRRTLNQVIDYCDSGNITEIMDLTDRYMLHHCRGKNISRPVDVYLAIFCPANIGADQGKVLYSGYGNPSYYLNKGLDGWRMEDNGRILRQERWCDGAITVGELALVLEAKKNALLAHF